MADRLAEIEARLRALEETVAGLSRQLAPPERTEIHDVPSLTEFVSPALPGAGSGAVALAATRVDAAGVLSLIGRTFIVLGGAYLLRALTQSGQLPGRAGVAIGLAYAALWLLIADRAAAARRPMNGLFHGVSAVMIGLPILWEATTRFHFLEPATAGLTLAALTALAIGVAWHRRLESLAGLVAVGAIVTSVALAAATVQARPFAVLLVALSVTSWAFAERLEWRWPQWPAALATDVVLAGLIARTARDVPLEPIAAVIGIAVLFTVAFLGPFLFRTIAGAAEVTAFEMCQTVLVLVVGVGGLFWIGATAAPALPPWIGLGCLTVSVTLYGLAFTRVLARQGDGPTFYYVTTIALSLLLVGGASVAAPPTLSLTSGAMAVALLVVADRTTRAALTCAGAVLFVTAAIASGLFADAAQSWLGRPDDWPRLSPIATAVLFLTLAGCAYGAGRDRATPRRLASVARTLVGLLAIFGLGGVLVRAFGPAIAGTPPDPGVLATLKTGLLAAAAVCLARIGRTTRWRELGWLAYPVIMMGGLKLVVEDFGRSRPSTLFIALAMYGAALVAAPRIKNTPHG
jgi:hypothetical protein